MRGRSSAIAVADLHLHDRVAAVEIAAHLGTQLLDTLARDSSSRPPHRRRRAGSASRLCRSASRRNKRLAGDLGHRVPDRHVDGADRDRALAVAARLLVLHQRRPDAVRIEIVAGIVQQRLRIGLLEPRREALADQPALPVAAVRVEAVADHRAAVALHVGHDRDERQRHLGEVDVGVGDRRGDRRGHFADIDDAHAVTPA